MDWTEQPTRKTNNINQTEISHNNLTTQALPALLLDHKAINKGSFPATAARFVVATTTEANLDAENLT
ncbi:hypothetical protein [Photobacterium iliopiscarium]|uniref:Uncharacterized protein n=1 Tax=Photobacterium iliopiscarium TaxID=56192 RepID=A0A2T3MF82_9GAMM|nr:hypothetical protein [Photobacterium iliopiscarium]PSV92424.1 hypothetical protein C9I88_16375 [Photobacterium iliopiscarium]